MKNIGAALGLSLLFAVHNADAAAPDYQPDVWNTADQAVLKIFNTRYNMVLDQMRSWHFSDRSVSGLGRTLHDYDDATIAAKIHVDAGNVAVLRKAFYEIVTSPQLRANCYSYMIGDTNDPPGWKAEPGENAYGRITKASYEHPAEEFLKRLQADGVTDAGQEPAAKDGFYLGALFLSLKDGKIGGANDFHFVRQNKDGTWSHKMGHEKVSNRDLAYRIITDPKTADFKDYKFVTYLYIPETGIDVKHKQISAQNPSSVPSLLPLPAAG